ncbi:MAG: hypothetical protein GWN99_15590 [Gemmatimonadetes bacterium]|uniref:Uncharacterized protein n=1 Tax=Candidatus Kutchimonas denitrificans TaxID=3056748 RepID=A0AAE5C9R8_9BACT|nr:hypothetical protein [Gemmatimonadota bacterium]NIR73727.1 hypothetical protein [Candidatus Kutchimonas denitrificans]NIS02467.1 hypothetical protein [Gemmatimonadota bacterium]NIT67457.1 hypothetical protein [Gemmatimonadota bacterium]NIU51589.1 hypothetical protein [Gemmatimonadota bacterium]
MFFKKSKRSGVSSRDAAHRPSVMELGAVVAERLGQEKLRREWLRDRWARRRRDWRSKEKSEL